MPTADCGEQLLSSARKTERLDHLSFTWQQQNSWNCRKLLLGDKGNCWLMMRMCVGVCEAAVEQDSFPKLRWKQTRRKWLKLYDYEMWVSLLI